MIIMMWGKRGRELIFDERSVARELECKVCDVLLSLCVCVASWLLLAAVFEQ